VRELIEEMIRSELDAVLSRPRYGRRAEPADGSDVAAVVTGHRHGSRVRTLTGTFGKTEIAVPRARLNTSDGKTTEGKSQALRKYQRRTLAADALIAGVYLAGTNTRRGAPRTSQRIWRRGWQGHCEPGLAQGEGRLGRLELPLAGRRANRAA